MVFSCLLLEKLSKCFLESSVPFYTLIEMCDDPVSLYPGFGFVAAFQLSHSDVCAAAAVVVLICISLATNDVEHFSMCTFVISVSSSVKCLCCCPFSNWFGFFFYHFLFTLLDQVAQSAHTPLSVLSP